MNAIAELRDWIFTSVARCRERRSFDAAFRFSVAMDIVRDASAQQQKVARDAYSAEQSDLEAVKILQAAAEDGFTNADLPAVEKAIRLIRRSADKDHAISDATNTP